ncbi:hypothetical protein E5A73_16945 [Sphingomonas gei]|uniref:Uncharacterized protein n=1 Tax=Sphingomonas gei TaxID=1395960 RepID=A0A4S1X2F2_9SPHN|nr:hypothetical protein [Sphingomonas gei]TGX50114.1 hypothetical protein E5A73_16945 [Sphingomonas gei]
MLDKDEANDLIAGLERASQRSRPYVVFGLVAIVAGFVILAVYLNYQRQAAEDLRRAAEQRAAEQTVKVADLTATLTNARLVAREAHPPERAAEQWERLSRLLQLASGDVRALGDSVNAEVAEAASVKAGVAPVASPTATPSARATADAVPAPAAPPPVVRLFVHIADESQRPAAQALASGWAGREIDGIPVVVPGIQLARSDPENTLRCTKAPACARLVRVSGWVNASLASPQLRPIDVSRLYVKSRGIRPGSYELWFAPGEIAPARGVSAK